MKLMLGARAGIFIDGSAIDVSADRGPPVIFSVRALFTHSFALYKKEGMPARALLPNANNILIVSVDFKRIMLEINAWKANFLS